MRGLRRRKFEWPNGVLLLVGKAQRDTAGSDDGEMGCGGQELDDNWRRARNLLEIVEQKQRMLLAQGACQDRQRRST